MNKLTLGSLFSGSGGFELAGVLTGITPVWASEIEPFPIRVTTKRFPNMKHLGNIENINGSEIEPVYIITFGSPCTDLSIAGKREGLGGKKSSLFFEAIRVIKEMREKTNGKYPRYIIWENVKGAFSSNKGEDFRCVLEEIVKIKEEITVPKPTKWKNAGFIVGDDYSVSWRVLDAQYFGVPQRRKRIFLVADFASTGAGEILFVEKSLPWDTKKSKCERKETTRDVRKSSDETICLNDHGGERMDVSEGLVPTLRATSNHPPLVFENHSQDSRFTGPLETMNTVSATYGTGGNNQPFVLEEDFKVFDVRFTSEGTKNKRANSYETKTSRTIDTGGNPPDSNQGGLAVISIQGSMIGRKEENGPRGSGFGEDVSFTLNTTDRHAVLYHLDRESFNSGVNFNRNLGVSDDGIASTLKSVGPSAVSHPVFTASKNSHFTSADENLASTLVATDYKDPQLVTSENENREYIVRRLTPTECLRLQGFPDFWCEGLESENPSEEEIAFFTDVFETYRLALGKSKKAKTRTQIIKWLNNPRTDTAEYKMWGNGVALPSVVYIMERLVDYNFENPQTF